MKKPCQRLWEIDAFREGRLEGRDAESFVRHRDTCDECRERFIDDERLQALGRALPVADIDPLRARRLRQSILREAAVGERSSPFPRFWSIAPIVAALVVLLIAGWRWRAHPDLTVQSHMVETGPVVASVVDAGSTSVIAASPRPFGASIAPETGAVWKTKTERETERIVLTSGALSLVVRHREPGERFIVDLPDGEIEVRGTQFRVDVQSGTTRSVRVTEGLVAFRRFGAAEILIAANESWPAEKAPTTVTAESKNTQNLAANRANSVHKFESLPPRGTSATHAQTPPSSAAETAEYEAAVGSFVAKHYDEAARRLHAFVVAHPARPEAEDAAFLEASALAYVGRADAAGVVAEAFLERYPASLHAADAATLAVRAARSRGDCAHARTLAARAITDDQARSIALGACASP